MRILLLVYLSVFLLAFMGNMAWADERVDIYLHEEPTRHTGPEFKDRESNPCFPHNCRDIIQGPLKNPDPDARKPENLTACIYGADGVLLYERENKICPYKYTNAYELRVERRRQEWLRSQAR